ncbi:MAG: hypothetical protein WBQ25_16615 [Nitrososphaeraceae archaeon]
MLSLEHKVSLENKPQNRAQHSISSDTNDTNDVLHTIAMQIVISRTRIRKEKHKVMMLLPDIRNAIITMTFKDLKKRISSNQ